jgi:hypothetical protein
MYIHTIWIISERSPWAAGSETTSRVHLAASLDAVIVDTSAALSHVQMKLGCWQLKRSWADSRRDHLQRSRSVTKRHVPSYNILFAGLWKSVSHHEPQYVGRSRGVIRGNDTAGGHHCTYNLRQRTLYRGSISSFIGSPDPNNSLHSTEYSVMACRFRSKPRSPRW